MGTSCHQDKYQQTYGQKTFHARKDRKNSNEKCRAVVSRQPLFGFYSGCHDMTALQQESVNPCVI